MRRLMLVVLMLLGLAGIAQAQENVTLLFWPGPESNAMQKVIDAYNAGPGKQDGVHVKQLLYSRQGFFDKELSDLSAGSKAFDLNLVTTYTLGQYAPYLTPIDSYIQGDPTKDFLPAALKSLNFDGKQYGVPSDVSLHFLYYRSDLIQKLMSDSAWQTKYGDISEKYLGTRLQPKDPQNWDWNDYIATSLFFTKSINSDSPTQYGTALQLKNLIFNIMIWDDVLVSNGGNWLDSQGNVTIDSPAAKRALQIYQTIIDNKAAPPGSLNYEFPESNQAFMNDQVATMLQWNAAFATLNDPKQAPKVAGKVGIAPPPAGEAGHATHVHSLGIGMNAASTHKEAAAKFLNYLLTADAMKIYADAGGSPPVASVLNSMAAQRPDFAKMAEYLDKYGYVIRGGTAAYAVPAYTVLADQFSAVWSGQKSIDAALSDAATKLKALVNP